MTLMQTDPQNLPGDSGKSSPSSSPSALVKRIFQIFSGQGARAGYLAATEQAILSVSNFIATLLLARSVSPTELGVYGVGFTSLRLIRSIQEGLTIQPLNAYGAALDGQKFKIYASRTSLLQILLALVEAAGVAILGWILIRTGNDTAGPGIFALWPAFLWWQLQEYLRRMLYSRGRVLEAAINTLLSNAIRLALMVYWLQNGSLSGVAGIKAIAVGSFFAIVPSLWQTRIYWTRQIGNPKQTWLQNWDFGRWVMGGSLANWISVEFYPVMTAGMISFAATGAYRALQNLVAPVHLLLRATDTFLTPRAARAYHESGMPGLSRMLKLTYAIAGIPILGLLGLSVAFPKAILGLLYGSTYLEYSPAMVSMSVFYALWFLYWPLQSVLKAARLSRPIFIANLAAILAMFTIGIVMISRWGVYGTIAGQALNAAIVAAILWLTWKAISK